MNGDGVRLGLLHDSCHMSLGKRLDVVGCGVGCHLWERHVYKLAEHLGSSKLLGCP